MHVHYYDFYTSEDNQHRHHVKGVDHPAHRAIDNEIDLMM